MKLNTKRNPHRKTIGKINWENAASLKLNEINKSLTRKTKKESRHKSSISGTKPELPLQPLKGVLPMILTL